MRIGGRWPWFVMALVSAGALVVGSRGRAGPRRRDRVARGPRPRGAGAAAMVKAAIDLDALAGLEEQRRFLLQSIRDLDREHAAGDLDEEDYRTLKDDYTARAAAVLRAL